MLKALNENNALSGGIQYTFQEDEYGDVIATDYYHSQDDENRVELVNWKPETNTVRIFFAYRNNFDLMQIFTFPKRCLIVHGFWDQAMPAGQWTEIVADIGESNWLGWHIIPESNWQGSCNLDQMLNREITVQFYSLGIALAPSGKPRRGAHKWRLRKLFQTPGRVIPRIAVPCLMNDASSPQALARFNEEWDAAAPHTAPANT